MGQPAPKTPPDAWATIVEIGLQERAFNTLEATYTALASTWLLATFAGVGFMLSAKPTLPVPTEVVVLSLGLAGAVGITLVWVIDVLVYHRLLDAAWWTGLAIEIDHEEIPPMRILMYALGPVTPMIRMFYLGMLAAPLAIATFGAAWSAHLVAPGRELTAVVFGLILSTVWLVAVHYLTEANHAAVKNRFASLGSAAETRFDLAAKGWAAKAKALGPIK
jgi:hypothetical protein